MINEHLSKKPTPQNESAGVDKLAKSALDDTSGLRAYQLLWDMLDRGYDLNAFQQHALTQIVISRCAPVLGQDLLNRDSQNFGGGNRLRSESRTTLRMWLVHMNRGRKNEHK